MRFFGWLRGLGRDKAGATVAYSRVAIPSLEEPPPDVLREIREWNPKLDLHILPQGRVWLLLKSDIGSRIDEGRKQLAAAKEDGLAPERSSMLMAAGFELLSEETYLRAQSSSYLIRVADQKLSASKKQIEMEINRRAAESDGTMDKLNGLGVLREKIRSEAVSDWKWAHKGKKSFARVM